jgi:hypothetical protein
MYVGPARCNQVTHIDTKQSRPVTTLPHDAACPVHAAQLIMCHTRRQSPASLALQATHAQARKGAANTPGPIVAAGLGDFGMYLSRSRDDQPSPVFGSGKPRRSTTFFGCGVLPSNRARMLPSDNGQVLSLVPDFSTMVRPFTSF